MKCVVVVPTYNEAENLERLLQQIHSHAPYAHVILMDDISPDGTADHAEALFLRHPEYANYSVIRRSGQRGLGRAYRDGFQRALDLEYDRIIQMDADLSHDPAYLPALLEACETADIVIGSRYCKGGGVKNWPTHRVLLSKFACWYVQLVGKLPMRDATAGFRCWTRRALQAVEINSLHSEGDRKSVV